MSRGALLFRVGITRADVINVVICLCVLPVHRDCIRMQELVVRHVDLQALSI